MYLLVALQNIFNHYHTSRIGKFITLTFNNNLRDVSPCAHDNSAALKRMFEIYSYVKHLQQSG